MKNLSPVSSKSSSGYPSLINISLTSLTIASKSKYNPAIFSGNPAGGAGCHINTIRLKQFIASGTVIVNYSLTIVNYSVVGIGWHGYHR